MSNPNNQNGTMNQDPNININNQNIQDSRDSKMKQNGMQNHPDGYMIQNGKMMMVKNGKMTMIEKDITLSNGTMIMRNGNYINKGGTKMMMKEGQHMDMSGKMIPMKTTNP